MSRNLSKYVQILLVLCLSLVQFAPAAAQDTTPTSTPTPTATSHTFATTNTVELTANTRHASLVEPQTEGLSYRYFSVCDETDCPVDHNYGPGFARVDITDAPSGHNAWWTGPQTSGGKMVFDVPEPAANEVPVEVYLKVTGRLSAMFSYGNGAAIDVKQGNLLGIVGFWLNDYPVSPEWGTLWIRLDNNSMLHPAIDLTRLGDLEVSYYHGAGSSNDHISVTEDLIGIYVGYQMSQPTPTPTPTITPTPSPVPPTATQTPTPCPVLSGTLRASSEEIFEYESLTLYVDDVSNASRVFLNGTEYSLTQFPMTVSHLPVGDSVLFSGWLENGCGGRHFFDSITVKVKPTPACEQQIIAVVPAPSGQSGERLIYLPVISDGKKCVPTYPDLYIRFGFVDTTPSARSPSGMCFTNLQPSGRSPESVCPVPGTTILGAQIATGDASYALVGGIENSLPQGYGAFAAVDGSNITMVTGHYDIQFSGYVSPTLREGLISSSENFTSYTVFPFSMGQVKFTLEGLPVQDFVDRYFFKRAWSMGASGNDHPEVGSKLPLRIPLWYPVFDQTGTSPKTLSQVNGAYWDGYPVTVHPWGHNINFFSVQPDSRGRAQICGYWGPDEDNCLGGCSKIGFLMGDHRCLNLADLLRTNVPSIARWRQEVGDLSNIHNASQLNWGIPNLIPNVAPDPGLVFSTVALGGGVVLFWVLQTSGALIGFLAVPTDYVECTVMMNCNVEFD